MLGKLIILKKFDLRSLVVNVIINGQSVKNSLIDLDVAIHIVTKDTMKKMNIEGLRTSPQFYSLKIVLLSLVMG